MTKESSACGKIILTGEYAVVFGAAGIAVPTLRRIRVKFTDGTPDTVEWNAEEEWKRYALSILALCRKGTYVPTGTLHVESELPLGKGMGTSTALVIAICRCVIGEDCYDQALAIENEVNPGNSGLDFATIWAEEPLLYKRGDVPRRIILPSTDITDPLLIDTGSPGETTKELVAMVKEHAEEPEIKQALAEIGQCTQRLLAGESLVTIFKAHHRAQCTLGVVPEETKNLITKIEQLGGAAKVIGAGGKTGGGGIVFSIGIPEEKMPGEFPLITLS